MLRGAAPIGTAKDRTPGGWRGWRRRCLAIRRRFGGVRRERHGRGWVRAGERLGRVLRAERHGLGLGVGLGPGLGLGLGLDLRHKVPLEGPTAKCARLEARQTPKEVVLAQSAEKLADRPGDRLGGELEGLLEGRLEEERTPKAVLLELQPKEGLPALPEELAEQLRGRLGGELGARLEVGLEGALVGGHEADLEAPVEAQLLPKGRLELELVSSLVEAHTRREGWCVRWGIGSDVSSIANISLSLAALDCGVSKS